MGKLKKGGIVDVEVAARIVLHDWNEGKIPYFTMPPTRHQETSEAKRVSELGKEFKIDEVYHIESSYIGCLKSVEDFNPVEVPPSCPLNFDENMLEVNHQPQTSTQGDQRPEDVADDVGDQPMEEKEQQGDARGAGKMRSYTQQKGYSIRS